MIKAVYGNLTEKKLGRMPSKALLGNMMIECLTLAQAQLAEELSDETKDNFTIQTDGTTKYGQHFAMYDIATNDNSYVLGLRHVFLDLLKILLIL